MAAAGTKQYTMGGIMPEELENSLTGGAGPSQLTVAIIEAAGDRAAAFYWPIARKRCCFALQHRCCAWQSERVTPCRVSWAIIWTTSSG